MTPNIVVKQILRKAWNLIYEVDVSVLNRNIFMFTFRPHLVGVILGEWKIGGEKLRKLLFLGVVGVILGGKIVGA